MSVPSNLISPYSLSASTYLDENTFEKLFSQLNYKIKNEITINIGKVGFIDPYGMIGLLELGWYLRRELGIIPILTLSQSEDVLKYLERMDFLKNAGSVFKIDTSILTIEEKFLRSKHSDVLLEITTIKGTDDIHLIVDKVRERAEVILHTHLNYDTAAIDSFIVALSEICQNIPEHSQNVGYVGIQKYFYGKKLGKNVVKIAVADGIIAKLITHLNSNEYGDKYILLRLLNPTQRENVEVALEYKKLAVLSFDENKSHQILGALNTYLRDILNYVLEKGKLSARELANLMNLEINTSSTRLLNLYKLRIVSRTEELLGERGRQFIYESILP